jgi:hypothetical protein
MDAAIPVLVTATAWIALAERRRAAGRRAPGWPQLDAALAPAVGFGSLSLVYFAWRFVGLGNSSFALLAWPALVAVAAWGLWGLVRDLRSRTPALGRQAGRLLAAALCAGLLVYLALAFVLYARQLPVGQFDAWAIWSSRARLLFAAEDPAAALALLRRAHPDYPLFLPGALAAQFALAGAVSVPIPQWTGALFPAAGAAIVGVGVRQLGASAAWSWVAALLLLGTPLWIDWGFAQCADVPLACLLAGAALALALQLRPEVPALSPALAGFLVGLAAWTKNEGMILSLLLLGLFALWSLAAGCGRAPVGRVALGAALPWSAALAFKLAWKPTSDLRFFLDEPWRAALEADRWRIVGTSFAERLDPFGGFPAWGLVWTLASAGIAITLATPIRRRPEVAFLLTLVACCWVAWFGIFVATPLDLSWHVRTALDRLMLQLLPVTLLTAFAGAGLAAQRAR